MDVGVRAVQQIKSKRQWVRKTFGVALVALGTVTLLGVIAALAADGTEVLSSALGGGVMGMAFLVGGMMLYRGPTTPSVIQQPREDRSGLPPLPPPPPGKLPFNRLAVWAFILSLYPIATPFVPIILGFVARSQIKERFWYGRVERGRVLANSAIVAGFLWTALLVLLIAGAAQSGM